MTNSRAQPTVTVISAAMMTTVLGSIHAFSVFVPEWETLQGADRSAVSLVYSVALISLTVAVLFGHHLFRRLSAPLVFLLAGAVAASGLILSAQSPSLGSLYLWYGVIFGCANGLGYGYALQLSGQAMPDRKGMAMGVVTAFYAVGATAFPVLFTWLIGTGGNSLALQVMSLIVLLISGLAAVLVYISKARFQTETTVGGSSMSRLQKRARVLLWLGYGAGAAAGLMVIGHAYGIALWAGLTARDATVTVTLLAFGNMLGGFGAGYISDRVSWRLLLFWLPALSGLALAMVYWVGMHFILAIWFSIAVIGFAYGALIAVYPVAVSDVFGERAAPRVYGQVFTAWGFAGLIGPWSSGWFFDRSGSYGFALSVAVVLCAVSALVMRYFPVMDADTA